MSLTARDTEGIFFLPSTLRCSVHTVTHILSKWFELLRIDMLLETEYNTVTIKNLQPYKRQTDRISAYCHSNSLKSYIGTDSLQITFIHLLIILSIPV